MYDQLGAGLYPLGVRYDDSEGKVVATVEQDDMKQILKPSMSGTTKVSSTLTLQPVPKMQTTRLAPLHRLVRCGNHFLGSAARR